MPYAAKAKTQQFARRKPNLMKKADQLARLCHADVALIIRRNGRYYTYRSTDHERWPPTMLEIVSMYLLYRPLADTILESLVSVAYQSTLRRLRPHISSNHAQVRDRTCQPRGKIRWNLRKGHRPYLISKYVLLPAMRLRWSMIESFRRTWCRSRSRRRKRLERKWAYD